MTIEEKEIGLGLELEKGTFENTGLTEDGVLVLLGTNGELPNIENIDYSNKENIIPKMSSNSQGGVVAKASSEWSSAYSAYLAFNHSEGSQWASANGQNSNVWLQIEFDEPKRVTHYRLSARAINEMPKTWDIYAGDSENELKKISSEDFNNWSSNKDGFFQLKGFHKYKIFRIFVKQNNGYSSYVVIAEWELYNGGSTEEASNVITEGYWESDVIDLKHKFKEFKKVSLTSIVPDSSQVGIEVRMSDSGSNFTPYQQTAEDGTFQSPARRYIQVKINLYAGYTAINNIIDFTEKENLKKIHKDYYFESTEEGLKINSDDIIAIPMELDEEYTGEGYVYVAELEKDEFITETITKLDIL